MDREPDLHRRARALKRAAFALAVLAAHLIPAAVAQAATPLSVPELRQAYATLVEQRLSVPDPEASRYGRLMEIALREHGAGPEPQFVLLVDRAPSVQAMFVYLRLSDREARLIGASPVSIGRPGAYEHFATPAGVFEHTLRDPDFRAEGTKNAQGVRGYGKAGMRVFDFGWIVAPRGWGDGGAGTMRLQVHATDPDLLEGRLGTACSKGCIRIPSGANVFLDRHGVLDADYERALREGHPVWQLRSDRLATPWSGRYLVVVDSGTLERPVWAAFRSRARPLRPR